MITDTLDTDTKIEELRGTHWHKGHLEAWEAISNAIPAVAETELRLWALRVTRSAGKAGAKLPPGDCKYLWAITASHYAKRDGVSAPDGQEMTFLVSADSRRAAYDRVQAELTAHGLNGDEWAIGSTVTPLILNA
jgi:hypothetical protein